MAAAFDDMRDERQLKALTGIPPEAFKILLEAFEKSLEEIKEEEYLENSDPNKRKPGGGGNRGVLDTPENSLPYTFFSRGCQNLCQPPVGEI
jgi:hypothetical protein